MIITCHAHSRGATHDIKAGVDVVRKLIDVYQEGWGHTIRVEAGVKVVMPICLTDVIKHVNETRDEARTTPVVNGKDNDDE